MVATQLAPPLATGSLVMMKVETTPALSEREGAGLSKNERGGQWVLAYWD